MIQAGIAQLKYYLYLLYQEGTVCQGELRVPKEKKVVPIELTEADRLKIDQDLQVIGQILDSPVPPAFKKTRYCRSCSLEIFCTS